MAASEKTRRPWWRRHFKKTLLLAVMGAVLIGYVGVRLVRTATLNLSDESGAYQQAMQKLRAAPAAAQLLGPSIDAESGVRGRIEGDGDARQARLAIPVSGARAAGTLHVRAERTAGRWTYERLELTIADNSLRVSLLPDATPHRVRQRDSLTLDRLYEGLQHSQADSL